jgi:transposase
VTDAEHAQLLRWVRSRTSPHRLVVRSRIILLASQGVTAAAIARRVHVSPATVRLWCRRFALDGVCALEREAPGRGRRPGMARAAVVRVLRVMSRGPGPAPRWTARTLGTAAGTSPSTVWRVWQRHGLGPAAAGREVARALQQVISETEESS